MAQFFENRIIKSNQVISKFLESYPQQNLKHALEKILSPEGSQYCLYENEPESKVCGAPLTDLLLTAIGQGRGRGLNTTEVWDGLRDNLVELDKSTTDPEDKSKLNFLNAAKGAAGFFHNSSIVTVFSEWAQEFEFYNGNIENDCALAYRNLKAKGYDINKLLIDECRIIKNVIPQKYISELEKNYKLMRSQDELMPRHIVKNLFQKNNSVKYFMYSGGLDLIVQPETLKTFSSLQNVKFKHYENYGHAGWLFVPEVWENLLK